MISFTSPTESHFSTDVWKIIDAVGTERFLPDLLQAINPVCGADHCSIFRLTDDQVRELGCASLDGSLTAQRNVDRYMNQNIWRTDPAMAEGRRISSNMDSQFVIHADLKGFPDEVRSNIYGRMSDRLMVFGSRQRAGYCLSLVRSDRNGRFGDNAINHLQKISSTLQSLIAKHAEVLARQPARSLTSLEEIEINMLDDGRLSNREAQVCARVLYGISSTGIALDLKIGEETVKTYRSRAYQRLGIGSPRELLIWYLAIWKPTTQAA